MAESNGNTPAMEESEAATAGLVEDLPTTTEAAAAAEEPIRVSKGIYFVRVPRPHFDDTTIKNLQQELTNQIGKLKAINGKMQIKRGEANVLRQQLTDARGIREGSKPEYEDKMSRIKELQDMRRNFMDRIQMIRSGQKGLDVKTEEELDAKIDELEAEIQSGEVPLRVEKQLVQNISKLRNQREKVREFQNQQGDLTQVEEDLKKVRSILSDLQDEFKIITGERDQVKTIISDLQAKLKVVTDALSDLDLERQEIEAHKTEIQEQLKAAREENDAAMFEYRENRKLSLQLRDLVDAGDLGEATKTAEEQVELYLAKLINDPAYRKEYNKLWSEQRKYIVSELLPKSGVSSAAPSQAPAKGEKGARSSAPLVPQGAAKAQAAIAAAMEAANQALVAQRKAAPEPEPEESSEDEVAEPASSQPAEPARRIVPGASEELTAPSRPRQQHKAAEYIVPELPNVDYEFVPPVIQRDNKEQLTDKERKERVREEQRLKAAEAEERKKRRAETQERKKQKAVEQARKVDAEAKAKQRAFAAEAAAVPQEVAEVAPSASEEDSDAPKALAAPAEKPAKGNKAAGGNKAGKKPIRVEKVPKLPKKVKKWYMEYAVPLAVGGCVLVLLLLVLMAFAVPARS